MPRSIARSARVVVVVAAAALLVTCTETTTSPRAVQSPSFAISDGASGGNPDVFFLPPLASSPSGGSYGVRPPNPNLAPVAKVCTRDPAALQCVDPNTPDNRASLPMTYDATGGFYSVNWQTGSLNPALSDDSIYRIQIFVGTLALALRDILPQPSGRGGSCLTSDTLCTFNNGSNLAIKVRIQTDAVCLALNPNFDTTQPCATATLGTSGSLALSNLGVTSGLDTTATINMQPCNGNPNYDFRNAGLVDLPTFGGCVQINNVESYAVIGTATLCQAIAQAQAAGLTAAEIDRMTVHRNSGDAGDSVVYALPHGDAADCSNLAQNVSQAPPPDRLAEVLRLARRAWQNATDRLGVWLRPQPLWASPPAPPCHVGGCGGVGGFESYYQVVQPAWMDYDAANPGGALGTHNMGDVVTGVIDLRDSGELTGSPEPPPAPDPVNNVRLHVQVNGGTPTTILSGPPGGFADGVAQFQFTVAAGANVVKVWGKGVGTKGDPNTFLNVFAPLMSASYPSGQPVALRADTLVFTATGTVPLTFVPDPPTGGNTIYTDASGIATFPDFQVCANPLTAGAPITSLDVVTNNGTYKNLGNLPALPVVTGTSGCFTFSGVTINGTGAFRMVANGQYMSQKFNVKPGK